MNSYQLYILGVIACILGAMFCAMQNEMLVALGLILLALHLESPST
jgi:multisubunit Na+/H+ antiporter MnhG subunit